MNASGMTFVLSGVSAVLGMPFFQSIVADGSVRQDELDGTRENLSAIVTTLRSTPPDKIEAMVAQYNEQLTAYLDKFNSEWGRINSTPSGTHN
ncbi:MAG TPA: hypothetical protein VGB76_07725 [Pyrinomonadaceae bacterium]